MITAQAQTQDIYPFSDPQKQQQFQELLPKFRCLVCQNEDLAGSNSDLAKDLRAKIYRLVKAGKTDDKIIEYLTNRYGDFVLFKPPVLAKTYALWFAPFILLALGFLVLLCVLWRRRKTFEETRC